MSGKVTVIGLGNMGSALAGAMLQAGHELTVWNRSPSKAGPLAARGARVAATAEQAIAASPIAIVCLARYEHVRLALAAIGPGGLEGHTLVNLTWGTPEDAEEMERWVQAHGGDYLDGGIPVTPLGIGRRETELVYSGPIEVWERHATALRALGGTSSHVGSAIGDANVASLAIPGAFYHLAYHAFFEAAAYAAARGIAADALRGLARTALGVLDEVLGDAFRAIATGNYESDQVTVWISYDAMVMVRDAFERQGQQATMSNALVDVLQRAVAAGRAQAGSAALFPLLRDGG
jgi:3-hydroxyisobutyrate dehydrogenase-like beta-hydroxyacid dehydrogenase